MLIEQAHQKQIALADGSGFIIVGGAAHPEQIALATNAQAAQLRFDQKALLLSGAVQLFF